MLTYEEFKEKHQEIDLDKTTFTLIQNNLLRTVNYVTFNRIDFSDKTQLETFNKLLASVIISLYINGFIVENMNDNSSEKELKSEAIGEYKKEYYDPNSRKLNDAEKQKKTDDIIYKAIKETYGHTGLMYRGF
ncbi:hypothetical protein [uncultured Anaerococcus sp.]|mgnify:CR=1 FL=1|uniref:hypothetical protein n=1 Tax=uncultured Anaerococcus sp. TaxID=293428 RepID=UPI00261798EA|nr:hypothetical protein [uncultured Anaerococcus sp.]